MQILYNVTVNIDHEVEEEWLLWMRSTHIPDVMKTGHFLEAKICKVLAEDQGGQTYSIQYIAPDMRSYKKYVHEESPRLQEEHSAKYEGKFVAFRTILEIDSIHGQG
jgi:hypothetical protein